MTPGARVEISIAREGARWAVKHNGGFLGYAANRREALTIAAALVSALQTEGREVEFVKEPGSPALPLAWSDEAPGLQRDALRLKA